MLGKGFVMFLDENFGSVRWLSHCALWKKNDVNTGLASDEARLEPNDPAEQTLQARKWEVPRCIIIFYTTIDPLVSVKEML